MGNISILQLIFFFFLIFLVFGDLKKIKRVIFSILLKLKRFLNKN